VSLLLIVTILSVLKLIVIILSIVMLNTFSDNHHYSKCSYADFIILSIALLIAAMLVIIIPSVFMHSVIRVS
jgi:hypothetical protein